jgi:hypothetical protein
MTAFATRIQAGTAACAIAVAAAFTPAAVAQAKPAPEPVPTVGLGSSVVSPACDPARPACANGSPNTQASSPNARALSPNARRSSPNARTSPGIAAPGIAPSVAAPSTIFQNPLWWFGPPNPNAPPQTVVFQFYPLALLPSFLRPFFGWFEALNFVACIGGFTLHIGPYGSVSGSYGRGCA